MFNKTKIKLFFALLATSVLSGCIIDTDDFLTNEHINVDNNPNNGNNSPAEAADVSLTTEHINVENNPNNGNNSPAAAADVSLTT
ncbi:MAG: hypothetical protein DBO98_03870, partial [Candidatus Liberibacter europaeus]|nr:hypothetical protein [Candidatus Liberibacter europaeus]